MESHLATAYSKRSIALAENLADVHSEIDVELGAVLFGIDDLFVQRVWIDDVVDGRSTAGAKESIVEILADHDVIDAYF